MSNGGYFVNESGIVINTDEIAWMQYKAEREKAKTIQRLVEQIEQLNIRVAQLEKNNR